MATAAASLPGHGALTATAKMPSLLGHGALTATAKVTEFALTGGAAGHGALVPVVRRADTVTVFMCDGTHNLLDWGAGSLIPVPDNPLMPTTLPALINPVYCTLQTITWPDAAFPMAFSIGQGAATLTTAIRAVGGPFILVGYSQGAAITSIALNELLTGSLTAYAADCIAGVTFGNICRQPGKTAPGQTDPGGHGVWANHLLTDTPSWWWDFALPLDAACTIPDTTFGVDVQTAFEAFILSFTGGSLLTFLIQNLKLFGGGVQVDFGALGELITFGFALIGAIPAPAGMVSLGPHGGYYDTIPPGASLTCAQLAANYINESAIAAL
jgi:PE-PPE domain